MTVSLATPVRNARLDAIVTYAGVSPLVRIYAGSAPASANDALTGQTLLAELVCDATLAPPASGGVLTLNTITADSEADATGSAAFYRWVRADGSTVIKQGSVTATGGGGDLELNTVSIVAGGPVSVTAWTLTDGNP